MTSRGAFFIHDKNISRITFFQRSNSCVYIPNFFFSKLRIFPIKFTIFIFVLNMKNTQIYRIYFVLNFNWSADIIIYVFLSNFSYSAMIKIQLRSWLDFILNYVQHFFYILYIRSIFKRGVIGVQVNPTL